MLIEVPGKKLTVLVVTDKYDQLGNDTYINPSAIGVGRNPQDEGCDLEHYIEQKEKELRGTREIARTSNQRRKVRIDSR
jgi:hypothetical protein